MAKLFACSAVLLLLVASTSGFSTGRRLLQQDSVALARSTLEAARAVGGDASRASAAIDLGRRAADRADDFVDDDSAREVAAANALSASAGAALAAAALQLSGNNTRASDVSSTFAVAEGLINAVASAPSGEVSERVEDAADAAAEAAQGAWAAINAVRVGTKSAIESAFDDVNDVSEEADDAREAGAGSASIYGGEAAAHIALAGIHRFRNELPQAWNAAIEASIAAVKTASAAAATTSSNGGCAPGNVSQDAERLGDQLDDLEDDDSDSEWTQTITPAATLAQQIVSAARSACPFTASGQSQPPAAGK